MALALRMGERGLGQTAPNPSVGAVIVRTAEGGPAEVLARAWTQPGGRPHAETEALRRAGEGARGATAYVTLEPCSHHGRTPPCAQALVAAGIGRVVIGERDPDPRVSGRGIALLQSAGIAVSEGVLADGARWLHLGHSLRVTERRPFVLLKMALAADGAVPRGRDGKPLWATGPRARAYGHLLRARCDAILVGAGTVVADDPELTCRLPGLAARSPIRIVLDPGLRSLTVDRKLVRGARNVPLWVMIGEEAPTDCRSALEKAGVHLFSMTMQHGRLPVAAVLERLAGKGLTRLLVEGGPETWQAFLAAGLVDEAVIFRAGGHATLADGAGPDFEHLTGLTSAVPLELAMSEPVGTAHCWTFRRQGV